MAQTDNKTTFTTGATRQAGIAGDDNSFPLRYDLFLGNVEAIKRIARTYGEGDLKYGPRYVSISSLQACEELDKACTCGITTKQQLATPSADTQPGDSASIATSSNTPKPDEPPATQTDSPSAEGSAAVVTTETSSNEIPSTPADNGATPMTGQPGIRGGDLKPLNDGISEILTAPVSPNDGQRSGFMDWNRGTNEPLSSYKEAAAESAEVLQAGHASTSTTATLPVLSEVSSVDAVTKDLVSSETVLKLWNAHSPTCVCRRQLSFKKDNGLQIMDVRPNWKKGFPESVVFNHTMAHLVQYAAGDTSEDHLAHAAWSLCVLMHQQAHHPELMDMTNPTAPKEP